MDAFARRLEIIRILVYKRKETMEVLSVYFGVTTRTIQSDIDYLSLHFPIETVRGRHGCVRIMDSFHPFYRILSMEQETVLKQILSYNVLSDYEEDVINEIIKELG